MIKEFIILFVLIFFVPLLSSDLRAFNELNNNSELLTDFKLLGEEAPDFELRTPDGKVLRLSDFRGKVVLLDFWATWCAPCRRSIPDLVELQKEFADELVIIGISLDQPSAQGMLVPFIEYFGINYPVVIGTLEVVVAYGNIQAIPTSFLLNPRGEIVNKHVGYIPKAVYENEINEMLKEEESF